MDPHHESEDDDDDIICIGDFIVLDDSPPTPPPPPPGSHENPFEIGDSSDDDGPTVPTVTRQNAGRQMRAQGGYRAPVDQYPDLLDPYTVSHRPTVARGPTVPYRPTVTHGHTVPHGPTVPQSPTVSYQNSGRQMRAHGGHGYRVPVDQYPDLLDPYTVPQRPTVTIGHTVPRGHTVTHGPTVPQRPTVPQTYRIPPAHELAALCDPHVGFQAPPTFARRPSGPTVSTVPRSLPRASAQRLPVMVDQNRSAPRFARAPPTYRAPIPMEMAPTPPPRTSSLSSAGRSNLEATVVQPNLSRSSPDNMTSRHQKFEIPNENQDSLSSGSSIIDLSSPGHSPIAPKEVSDVSPPSGRSKIGLSTSTVPQKAPESFPQDDDTSSSSSSAASSPMQVDQNSEDDVEMEEEVEKECGKKSTKKKASKSKDEEKEEEKWAQIDRGVNPPKGLTRKEFSFKVAAETGKLLENPEKVIGKMADNPLELKFEETEKYNLLWRHNQIGPDFQADINNIPFFDLKNGDPYGSDSEYEEEISKPLEEEEKVPGKADEFFEKIQDQYWRPIYLQFEARIPYEVALEHLKQSGFNIELALDSVDQKLESVTQELKPMCVAQALKLGKIALKDEHWMRQMQEVALRNYHLGEVQQFQKEFEKYYTHQKKEGVACTCYSLVHHSDIPYQPRVSCSNCNRFHRSPFKGENEPEKVVDQNEWCLFCQTYFQITKEVRPATKVVFTERELEVLRIWSQKEAELQKKLDREQVEQMMLKDDTARWERLELTDEEWDMVKEAEPEYLVDQKLLGKLIAAKLQPFRLPFYTKCQCWKHGGLTIKSPNFEKWEWSLEEETMWREVISEKRGDVVQVASVLRVEPGLVERFLRVYKKRSLKKRYKNFDLPPAIPTDAYFGLPKPTQSQLRQQRATRKRRRISE